MLGIDGIDDFGIVSSGKWTYWERMFPDVDEPKIGDNEIVINKTTRNSYTRQY